MKTTMRPFVLLLLSFFFMHIAFKLFRARSLTLSLPLSHSLALEMNYQIFKFTIAVEQFPL